MVSKYQFQQSLTYQPNTDIPINKLGITDAHAPIDYEATLATHEKPNLYIQAAIDCVQLADTRKLQNIILNGLQKRETP